MSTLLIHLESLPCFKIIYFTTCTILRAKFIFERKSKFGLIIFNSRVTVWPPVRKLRHFTEFCCFVINRKIFSVDSLYLLKYQYNFHSIKIEIAILFQFETKGKP